MPRSLKPTHCELCAKEQPLSFHHLIPRRNHGKRWFRERFSKDEMTRRGLWLCRLCHRQLHRTFSEKELGQALNTREAILEEPGMQRFLEWARKRR